MGPGTACGEALRRDWASFSRVPHFTRFTPSQHRRPSEVDGALCELDHANDGDKDNAKHDERLPEDADDLDVVRPHDARPHRARPHAEKRDRADMALYVGDPKKGWKAGEKERCDVSNRDRDRDIKKMAFHRDRARDASKKAGNFGNGYPHKKIVPRQLLT